MMNILYWLLSGFGGYPCRGNPTLTPVSGGSDEPLGYGGKGGWIVGAGSAVRCVFLYLFERLAHSQGAGKEDPLFMERIRDYIRTGEVKSAINYCRITSYALRG